MRARWTGPLHAPSWWQMLAATALLLGLVAPPGAAAQTTTPVESPADGPADATTATPPPASALAIQEYEVPARTRPHDVAPAPDSKVWYTAQGSGELGLFDPATGESTLIPLGRGSSPHGVIVGPDGAPWVTDSGQNAIVRVDPATLEVQRFPLPPERAGANLNTATFDRRGLLWFTGQSGVYGRLDPATGQVEVWDAPRGRGPYGITTTPSGEVYYASLAGSHIARINIETGEATPIDPPLPTRGRGGSGLTRRGASG